MDWRETTAEGFPAPRDDEPASLRQDIIDELADHLHCALNRELSKDLPLDEAVQNVHRRFGDPRAIARRLWFDSMKEAIMAKRLALVLLLLICCTTIAATAFAWVAIRDNARTNAELQRTNAALLQKLSTIALSRPEPNSAAANPNWVPAKLKLVLDEPKGAPAVGYQVSLHPRGEAAKSMMDNWQSESDLSGTVVFRLLPVGLYLLEVNLPWKQEVLQMEFMAIPGQPVEQTIVCPAKPAPEAEIEFTIEGLDKYKDKDVLIVCDLCRWNERTLDGKRTWRSIDARATQHYLFDTKGHFIPGVKGNFGVPFANPPHRLFKYKDKSIDVRRGTLGFDVRESQEEIARLKPSSVQRMPGGTYCITGVAVIPAFILRQASPNAGNIPVFCAWYTRNYSQGEYLKDSTFCFRPVAGQKNVITIPLPPPLIEAARGSLTDDPDSMAPAGASDNSAGDSSAQGIQFLKQMGMADWETLNKSPGNMRPYDPWDGGLVIHATHPGSPLAKAGVRQGDILVGLDRWSLRNANDVGWIRKQITGRVVRFHVLRGDAHRHGDLSLP
jgi:hypothetical protein